MRNQSLVTILVVAQLVAVANPGLRGQEPTVADQVRYSRIFAKQLIYVGETEPAAPETQALLNAINESKLGSAAISSLEQFIVDHPNSPWIPSLRANLASRYRYLGKYSSALDHWQAAWELVKDSSGANARLIGDQILGEWTELLASLGRLELLDELATIGDRRQFSDLEFGRRYSNSRISLQFMKENPGRSYRCGALSLVNVAKALGQLDAVSEEIKTIPSPVSGFSLSDLLALCKRSNLEFVAVKRDAGSELVVPSLVHWRQNHYAAITEEKDGHYRVVDPTFGDPKWLTADTINAEADGYFIVPAQQKPGSWRIVPDQEALTIHGKGVTPENPPPTHPPCWAPPGQCCGNGGPGSPGNGGAGSPPMVPGQLLGPIGGGLGSGGIVGPVNWSSGSSSGSAGGGCSSCGRIEFGRELVPFGMPGWRVTEPYITLWLEDEPMRFQAGLQKEIPIQLTFNQEDATPRNTNVFNIGPNWNFNLLSYVDISTSSGDDMFAQYSATVYGPAGGEVKYASSHGVGYPPFDYYTKATFTKVSDSGEYVDSIRLTFPDGSVFTYGCMVTIIDQCNGPDCNKEKLFFLTNRKDPSGRTELDLTYATNSGRVLLTGVKDSLGANVLTFSYSTNDPTQILAITNSLGETVSFLYGTNRILTNITDVAGFSSYISYTWTNSNPFVDKLVTPYGTTSFDYVNKKGLLYNTNMPDCVNRAIRVREETSGETHVFMYRDDKPSDNSDQSSSYLSRNGSAVQFIPYQYADVPYTGDTNTFATPSTNFMRAHNSFYWAPNQYASLSTTNLLNLSTNDYLKARLRNWLWQYSVEGQRQAIGETVNMEREPSPDGVTAGQKTWYAYWGKTTDNIYTSPQTQGTNINPSYVARLLPNGENQYVYREYNGLGKPTLEVSTYSAGGSIARRTNTFVYSADNIDLIAAYDRSGILISSNVYASHLLRTNLNALNEATIYTYNADGKVTSIQRPGGLTTTNTYDASGFLAKTIDLEISRTNSYTYANGLLSTHTDERGLTRSFTWDALKRLTSVAYPDSTYESNRYTPLDLKARKDRLGNWTGFKYDSLRRKIAETNALGRVTTFSYCTCGAVDSVTDPLNQTTHFYYDLPGTESGPFLQKAPGAATASTSSAVSNVNSTALATASQTGLITKACSPPKATALAESSASFMI